MPAYYCRRLPDFLSDSNSSILGELALANASALFSLEPEAIDAWNDQLPPLKAAFTQLLQHLPSAAEWHILLEYPIPMLGKRIDAVLLARNTVVVIETKTGKSRTSATRQVEDYSLDLACFHEPSAGKKIVPVVMSEGPVSNTRDTTTFDDLIEPCRICSPLNLAQDLIDICKPSEAGVEPHIDSALWNEGRFKPVPSIIRAAVALYSDMNVFEIGHSCAARVDLDGTTAAILDAVQHAREQHEKVICFVTGVPGAGKTLVGLNAVHSPKIREVGSFLSGNGPLVKVIQEALIRDVTQRTSEAERKSRRQVKLEVQAFIHSVHRFVDQYYVEDQKCPPQKVVVFDEAQRAWDAEQNRRKNRPEVSEPRMMLEIMDRHDDWAAIIALIGSGQEINSGEAGLGEWGSALKTFPHWNVSASPLVLDSGQAPGMTLFAGNAVPETAKIHPNDALHLRVSVRSIRAQQISDWVDALLNGRAESAHEICGTLQTRPALTRNLEHARLWLRQNRGGTTRAGLVTSASAARLRVDGVEVAFGFHQDFEWEHWFLDSPIWELPGCRHKYCNDVRSSSKLEVAATQFEVQGLELDWVGVCWGEDLLWEGDRWETRRFNNKTWKVIPETATRKRIYLRNAYRVLLTRARQSMILYVPNPSLADQTRLHADLNRTAEYLQSCGAYAFKP